MKQDPGLEPIFNPRSVALVGVSKATGTKSERYGRGAGFVGWLRKLHFPGRVYPIGPEVDEVFGHKGYSSLTQVPEPVDIAIITTSAARVPGALEDCIAAGVKNVHVFSSGFAETGTEEGRKLEEKVREIARRGKINLIGPNCMGVHAPQSRFSFLSLAFLDESGPVAFIGQSGGHTTNFVGNASAFGIRFSKVINYGNGTILEAPDYLEYLADDPNTRLITLYIEGVRDGGKLFRLVKEITPEKPIIIWKGGATETGAKAAASHTGSLAGDIAVWKAFFNQSGAVRVHSLEELIDVTMTFLYLPPPKGRHAGLIIAGGGQSVVAADCFSQEGLEVLSLPQEVRNELYTFIPAANTSTRNPVDLGMWLRDLEAFRRSLEVMAAQPSNDFLVVDPSPEMLRDVDPGQIYRVTDILCQFALENPHGKPIAVVLDLWESNPKSLEQRLELRQKLAQVGIAVYPTMSRASRALAKFLNYLEFFNGKGAPLPISFQLQE